MRAFLCIPMESSMAARIDAISRGLREATRMRANWVRRDNLHVTLRFLGEIEPELTVDLEAACRRVVSRLTPFTLRLDRLGCFPSVERARVVWIGGEAPPAYHGLVASLRYELQRLGFEPERKPTVVHATLARVKSRPDPRLAHALAAATPADAFTLAVDRLVLMESELHASGPVYAPLFTTHFSGEHANDD